MKGADSNVHFWRCWPIARRVINIWASPLLQWGNNRQQFSMDVAWLSLFNPLGPHLLWGDAQSSPKGSQPLRCWDRLQVENPIEFREKREGSSHAGKGTEGHFEIHLIAQVIRTQATFLSSSLNPISSSLAPMSPFGQYPHGSHHFLKSLLLRSGASHHHLCFIAIASNSVYALVQF